jgi:hypothetical protein
MTSKRFALITTGTALGAALMVSGCSSSSGPISGLPSAPPAAAPGTSGSPAATPTDGSDSSAAAAIGSILGSGGPLDVSKLCAAVPAADIQKLFKASAPALVDEPGECNWGNGGITVDIYFNDGDKSLYGGGGVDPATAATLPGVGDIAQWTEPVPGQTVPFLIAHKGTTSIAVSAGIDVDQSTMAYTGSAPFFHISQAESVKYATEEGQICTDLFNAGA